MKKFNALFILAVLLVCTQIGYSQTIVGSAHDFKNAVTYAWNTTGEICIVCHTPHNSKANAGAVGADTYAPLWNHTVTATASFTPYATTTLNATMGQPDGSSKLCLSCHDGTVALANFGTMTTGTAFIAGAKSLGTNLSDDHPVSFTYDAALVTADGGLKAITSAGIGTGTIAGTMLTAGKVQCSSCHDVHNGAGIAKLLVKSNAASALCLTCHNK